MHQTMRMHAVLLTLAYLCHALNVTNVTNIDMIIMMYKDAKVFGIWNTKCHLQKVFGKVFKYPKLNMYLVFYLNTNFWVFDTTLAKPRLTTLVWQHNWRKTARHASAIEKSPPIIYRLDDSYTMVCDLRSTHAWQPSAKITARPASSRVGLAIKIR